MITIKIEDVREMQRTRQLWNSVPLEQIVFTENGVPIEINSDVVEEFSYVGLSNIDFITTGYYKLSKPRKYSE